jgi:hypothetical protein
VNCLGEHTRSNSALEQAASAARPWRTAQSRTQARGGPRPVPRPPLLTAGVRWTVIDSEGV